MAGFKGQNAGNKHGKGRKGRSGRKTAKVEKADAQYLADFFFKNHTPEDIANLIKGKKLSVSKMMLAKALMGNEKFTLAVFGRLFPEKMNIEHSGTVSLKEVLAEVQKRKNENTRTTS